MNSDGQTSTSDALHVWAPPTWSVSACVRSITGLWRHPIVGPVRPVPQRLDGRVPVVLVHPVGRDHQAEVEDLDAASSPPAGHVDVAGAKVPVHQAKAAEVLQRLRRLKRHMLFFWRGTRLTCEISTQSCMVSVHHCVARHTRRPLLLHASVHIRMHTLRACTCSLLDADISAGPLRHCAPKRA